MAYLVVSTPLEVGGTIYSNGFFFVQTIFADRYIHRRELRLVSLKSSSSIENGIKKIFFCIVFLQGVIEVWTSEKSRVDSVVFIHIFRNFCLNFNQFCWNLQTISIKSVVDFLKDKKSVVDYFDLVFCQKIWLSISKFILFHQKQNEISSFSPLWLNLPDVQPQNNTNTILVDPKGCYSYVNFCWERSVIEICSLNCWLSKTQSLFLIYGY